MSRNKLDYCIIDGKEQEVSSGFKLVGGEGNVISCPICCACLNETFDSKRGCKIYNPIPYDVSMGETYKCKGFKPDVNSYDYELVKKEMKEM